jgi:hypothetical protein
VAGRVKNRKDRWPVLADQLHAPDELSVVNVSAGLSFKPTRGLWIPWLGEVRILVRDKNVLYDNGTSVRRASLVARFRLAETNPDELRGALVHIAQSPLRVPSCSP